MIDLMLGNADDAFSCGEVVAWFRPWRTHHFEINCSCGTSPCVFWKKIKDLRESAFHQSVLKELNLNYIVDSSKNLCWLIDTNIWAAQQGITVINLLVWKKPLSIAYSHWKRQNSFKNWPSIFIQYYKRFLQTKLPFISVCYNDFVSDVATSLKALCDAIGMPYFSGKELFWKKNHHYLFGSAGVRKQIRQGTSTIRATEEFHPEFLKHVEHLNMRIERDSAIQTILNALQQRTILNRHETNCPAREQFDLQSINRPFWYFLDYPRRIFRRHVPKKFIEPH